MRYRIESRSTAYARWRIVTPTPHRERFPFDCEGLLFDTFEEAAKAQSSMATANAAQYRVVASLRDGL